MASIRAEDEINNGIEHRWSIDGPLHNCLVGLPEHNARFQRQYGSNFPVCQNVMHIVQFKRCSRCFKDEDEENDDQGQPEIWRSKFLCAASHALNQESPPRDEQENRRNQERQNKRSDVEVDASIEPRCLPEFLIHLVHANHRVFISSNDFILVGIILVGSDLTEECRGSRKKRRKEPDEWNVDGVSPGTRDERGIAAEVPLAVFNKQVEAKKQESDGQEQEEAVVEKPPTDAKL